eukprot:14245183-Ditylum_brightwellii.AAC.1
MHDELGNGANFCDLLQFITVHVSMIRFVDDAMGQTYDFHNNHAVPEQLIECMQHHAQLWSDLLWVLGGLLELDKCLYHFIYYCFLADGTPIMRSQRPGPPLDVKQSGSNAKITIEYKNPFTPHKTLGHYKEPTGVHIIQKEKL